MQRGKFIVAAGALAAAGYSRSFGSGDAQASPADVVLRARETSIDIDGRSARVLELAGSNGAGIDAIVGRPATIVVQNAMAEPTSIHWHGLEVPNAVDGVAGVTQPPIAPGSSQTYRFSPGPSGTHWMHGHVPFQEVRMLAAPLVLRRASDVAIGQREIVVLLEDFTARDPAEIWRGLTANAAMSAMPATAPERGDRDVNDVDYDAYLANRRTLNDPEIVRVDAGETIRLRVINASSGTNYTLDFGQLRATAIATDGRDIVPLEVTRVPLAIAQRIDVLAHVPRAGGTFPIFALREGALQRSGIVLATRGSRVATYGTVAASAGPVLDGTIERTYRARNGLAPRRHGVVASLRLTGDMARYAWGIDGVPFTMDGARPPDSVDVKRGDRVSLTFVNETHMSHPMHLHGHAFQVVTFSGAPVFGAMRDTVLVPPRSSVGVAFDADNPGTWMLHCHNAWHLQAGLATTVKYVA